MKKINIARVVRVFALLAILPLLGELQHATSTNIEELFMIELVLLGCIALTTRIINLEKEKELNKPSGY